MHIHLESFSLTTTGLIVFWIWNGPMNLGANLLDSSWRGKSLVESHANLMGQSLKTVVVGRCKAVTSRTKERVAGLSLGMPA